MILGTYYLTYGLEAEELDAIDPATYEPKVHVFRSAQEAELAYEHKIVGLHDPAHYRAEWVEGGHIATTVGRIIFNDKIERALEETMGEEFDRSQYTFINKSLRKRDTTQFVDDARAGVRRVRDLAGPRRVQGPRLPLRHAGRHHDLQERRGRAADQAADPRQVRGARRATCRSSTRTA